MITYTDSTKDIPKMCMRFVNALFCFQHNNEQMNIIYKWARAHFAIDSIMKRMKWKSFQMENSKQLFGRKKRHTQMKCLNYIKSIDLWLYLNPREWAVDEINRNNKWLHRGLAAATSASSSFSWIFNINFRFDFISYHVIRTCSFNCYLCSGPVFTLFSTNVT